MWLAIGALFSLLMGVGTGILSFLGGMGVASAVIAGGVGFGGTATLILLAVGTVRGL